MSDKEIRATFGTDAGTGFRTVLRRLGGDTQYNRNLRLSRLCFIAQQRRAW